MKKTFSHKDLEDKDERIRILAAYEFLKIGDESGKQTLIQGLNSSDDLIQFDVIELLGNIGSSWAIEALGNITKTGDIDLRQEAAQALIRTLNIKSIPYLIGLLTDEEEIREIARVGLVSILGLGISQLLSDLYSHNRQELMAVETWWSDNSQLYEPTKCYYEGSKVDLGNWIKSLNGLPDFQQKELLIWLQYWSGFKADAENNIPQIKQWTNWWEKESQNYIPGEKYFFGNSVAD